METQKNEHNQVSPLEVYSLLTPNNKQMCNGLVSLKSLPLAEGPNLPCQSQLLSSWSASHAKSLRENVLTEGLTYLSDRPPPHPKLCGLSSSPLASPWRPFLLHFGKLRLPSPHLPGAELGKLSPKSSQSVNLTILLVDEFQYKYFPKKV